jgi:hypothetical protein
MYMEVKQPFSPLTISLVDENILQYQIKDVRYVIAIKALRKTLPTLWFIL